MPLSLSKRLSAFGFFSILFLVFGLLFAELAPAAEHRSQLKAVQLSSEWLPEEPLDYSAFMPASSSRPGNKFTGRLIISPDPERSSMEILRDSRGRTDGRVPTIASLPPMDIGLLQSGRDLIPAERGLVSDVHPYWEYFAGVGKAWDEPGDNGWSRAAIPFALQERGQNCTHNGVLTFLFKTGGEVSRVYYQLVSETCTYLRLNLWGSAQASTLPLMAGQGEQVVTQYRNELRLRLPVRALETLTDTFPGADVAEFEPGEIEDVTVYGLVVDGVHYMSGCQTRYGVYPFCEELHLPSYSTSKSVFTGLAWMRMRKLWPNISNQVVADLIPECDLPDGRWDDVGLDDLLDMVTGNYVSSNYMNDEDSLVWNFLNPETHALKVKNACEQYTRQSPPNQQWVYHTSDTYLMATALDEFLRLRRGTGVESYRDLVVSDLWQPLGLSPATSTSLRTFDSRAQAFGGLGLTFLPDDIARIGQFLGLEQGEIDGEAMFNAAEFTDAMFRGAGGQAEHKPTPLFGYSNGFWGAPGHSWLGCDGLVFLPFFSGFGGITVAVLPNDMVYYVFADSGNFQWVDAAREAHRLRPMCSG